MYTSPLNYSDFLDSLNAIERKVAPEELFFEGDLNLLFEGIRVSVVGSRQLSEAGIRRTRIVIDNLVKMGVTVVSGLAIGADTIAHESTIEKGGKTIAVLGTSLDKCNPSRNLKLLNHIKKHHLAVSQFPQESKTFPSNFPKRDLTMALFSDATIIIEATEKSGTRHQAWEAIKLGRQVFILENVIKDSNVEWAKKALSYGAHIMTRDNIEWLIQELCETSVLLSE